MPALSRRPGWPGERPSGRQAAAGAVPPWRIALLAAAVVCRPASLGQNHRPTKLGSGGVVEDQSTVRRQVNFKARRQAAPEPRRLPPVDRPEPWGRGRGRGRGLARPRQVRHAFALA